MNEKYWDRFVVTGRAADYLNYKNSPFQTEEQNERAGAKKHESDRSDRDGAGGSADR